VASITPVDALTRPVMGFHWKLFDEQALPPSATSSSCAPGIAGGLGGYGRQWSLLDASGGLHGSAVIQVEQFGNPAQASAAVTLRDTMTFRRCYFKSLERQLRAETGSNDVDPAVDAGSSEGGSSFGLDADETYRINGQQCTMRTQTEWQAAGSRLVVTEFSTCAGRFMSPQYLELLKDTKAMAGA
jgi:hypothetical protein